MAFEARRGSGTEAGGILIGRPTAGGFYVHDAIVLDDEDAGYAHYTRDGQEAQEALDAYIAESDDDHLGYVGDWHTHPQPVGPSLTDKSTMALFGRAVTQPILLVVAALGQDSVAVEFHATITTRLPVGFGSRSRTAAVQPEQAD
jgi:hypothetical protein